MNAVAVLESLYGQAISGLPGTESAEKLAKDYMKGSGSLTSKVDKLIRWQNTKCATTGFLTGLGGVITLPVAISADLGINLYVQLRMVAAIAYMGGHDIRSDRVRSFVYLALCGSSAAEILRDAGVKVAERISRNYLQKKISGEVIKKINQAVGARIITKTGSKGIINLTKAVPFFGGIMGGLFDGVTTNTIGNTAKKIFLE